MIDGHLRSPVLFHHLDGRDPQGPQFIVLCMRDGVLKTKLRAAELKGREIGLMPQWTEETQEVTLANHIKHKGFDTGSASSSLVVFSVRHHNEAAESAHD